MTTSIDSNVIAALWNREHVSNAHAAKMLGQTRANGRVAVSGPVYAELMAGPLRDEASLDHFFNNTGIEIEWTMDEEIWREAGRAYHRYVRRRKLSSGGDARRILIDFLIGAHAMVRGYSVLTLNAHDFAAAFPRLPIVAV
jgi:predicted nucleic acid-binding protein